MNKIIIDVSEHNGVIDFKKVKEQGIYGVIIRIGWIGNKNNHTIDKKFIENYNNARQAGLNIGFYVYSYVNSPNSMINAIEWVKNQLANKQAELPIFLDMEDESISSCTKESLTTQCLMFCKTFSDLGFKAGVYANKYWFTTLLDINRLLNYKIWLAEWNSNENHSLGYKVDLWQYSPAGIVAGIVGKVDMNKCLCECEENQKIEKTEEEIEVKQYVNGTTKEDVFADTNLTNKIGSLNPKESCECLGIYQNRAIVRYKVDNRNNYKIGFVEWLGGVK